jgi:hypothetical protein
MHVSASRGLAFIADVPLRVPIRLALRLLWRHPSPAAVLRMPQLPKPFVCRDQGLPNAASICWDERRPHRHEFENVKQFPSHSIAPLIAGLVESDQDLVSQARCVADRWGSVGHAWSNAGDAHAFVAAACNIATIAGPDHARGFQCGEVLSPPFSSTGSTAVHALFFAS